MYGIILPIDYIIFFKMVKTTNQIGVLRRDSWGCVTGSFVAIQHWAQCHERCSAWVKGWMVMWIPHIIFWFTADIHYIHIYRYIYIYIYYIIYILSIYIYIIYIYHVMSFYVGEQVGSKFYVVFSEKPLSIEHQVQGRWQEDILRCTVLVIRGYPLVN